MDVDSAAKNSEEQNARFFLRERYLYFLSSLCSTANECNLRMYDNTDVSCEIKAIDIDFQNIIVNKLKTALPNTVTHAILRTTDIISISINNGDKHLKIIE